MLCPKVCVLQRRAHGTTPNCCISVTDSTENTIGSILVLDFLRYVISDRRRVCCQNITEQWPKAVVITKRR
jgi:hypothetical protein